MEVKRKNKGSKSAELTVIGGAIKRDALRDI